MGDRSRQGERGSTSLRVQILLALALIVVVFSGFLINQRFQHLQQQVTTLEEQSQEAAKRAWDASEHSQVAAARATKAEQNAQEAAIGRAKAEKASLDAADEAALARQQAQVASQQAQTAREEAANLRERREAEIENMQQALSKIAETERTPLGLVVRLGSDSIRFDFDKAVIRPADREILSRIAGILLASYGFRIQVYGHTDDVGTAQYNQELSERRAEAVHRYFLDAGIDPQIISAQGYGKSSPRVSGTSSEARSRNRRVEIGIVDTVIDYNGEVARSTP